MEEKWRAMGDYSRCIELDEILVERSDGSKKQPISSGRISMETHRSDATKSTLY
jgi:hypothetical protein